MKIQHGDRTVHLLLALTLAPRRRPRPIEQSGRSRPA